MTLKNIFRILERESKTTTYKFALLRGVIDIIQDNSPYITPDGDRIVLPMGLLIEKWMVYYYPIFESEQIIPQIHGPNAKLAFAGEFRKVVDSYRTRGGYSAFYNDLKFRGVPEHLRTDFNSLAKKIRDTIMKMPMQYIGSSIDGEHYSIFRPERAALRFQSVTDIAFLAQAFGAFSIPKDYYDAFKTLGSFITGQDALLLKWAEFSVKASGGSLSIHKVINKVLKSPVTDREIQQSKNLYADILKRHGSLHCVWTGKQLPKNDMNIDHVIPFSIWKNNDLWNLLPAQTRINNGKRDKIPSPDLIGRRRDAIISYWEIIHSHQAERFEKEVRVALLGINSFATWKTNGIEQLKSICEHLITTRGFEEWKGPQHE